MDKQVIKTIITERHFRSALPLGSSKNCFPSAAKAISLAYREYARAVAGSISPKKPATDKSSTSSPNTSTE